LIAAERASYSVALMCRCLKVSRSGFYAWLLSSPSTRAVRDAELSERIRDIHAKSRGTYGSPRVHQELRAQGCDVGHKRVERLMRENGITARVPRRRPTTTVRDEMDPVAENILDRKFTTKAPDQVWVGDITYIRTLEGWLYLAVLIDLFSRRVVGWSMADHLRTELPMGALEMAVGHRQPTAGTLHHSDRGCQYTSNDYQAALRRSGLSCSMSRAGNCHDNAVAESFFGTLEIELFFDQPVPRTRDEARAMVHDYIEIFYNRERRHSTIGYFSPVEFEARYLEGADQQAA
jgi:transposase InsO family protein